MLSNVCDPILTQILIYFDCRELFALRCVSQRMKFFAELELKRRKKQLDITGKYKSFEELSFVCGFYSSVKTVTLRRPKLPVKEMCAILRQKLVKVDCLILDGFRLNRIMTHLFTDSLENIQSLHLIKTFADDGNLTILFRHLVHLKTVVIKNADIKGYCFANIGDKISDIEWFNEYFDQVCPTLTFNGKGGNLKRFAYNSCGNFDEENARIFQVVLREMPNLMDLSLILSSDVIGFNQLDLKNLVNLELSLNIIDKKYILPTKLKTVKTLSIHFPDQNELNLVTFLSNFPNIEKLHLNLKNGIHANLIDALSRVESLRSFSLRDSCYTNEKYMTICDGKVHSIIALVDELTCVSNFMFGFVSWQSTNITELVATINEIALQRIDHKFNINTNDLFKWRVNQLSSNLRIEQSNPCNWPSFFWF